MSSHQFLATAIEPRRASPVRQPACRHRAQRAVVLYRLVTAPWLDRVSPPSIFRQPRNFQEASGKCPSSLSPLARWVMRR